MTIEIFILLFLSTASPGRVGDRRTSKALSTCYFIGPRITSNYFYSVGIYIWDLQPSLLLRRIEGPLLPPKRGGALQRRKRKGDFPLGYATQANSFIGGVLILIYGAINSNSDMSLPRRRRPGEWLGNGRRDLT